MKKADFNDVITDVSPLWFDDEEQKKYLWTPLVIEDRDDIISHPEKKLDYADPQSLVGLTVGGVLGFYYFGLEELMQSKKILRSDTTSELQTLQMILSKRIDAGIVSASTFAYTSKMQNGGPETFYVSPKSHEAFTRHILVPPSQKPLHEFLTSVLQKKDADPEWQKILTAYGLK